MPQLAAPGLSFKSAAMTFHCEQSCLASTDQLSMVVSSEMAREYHSLS